MSQHYAAVRRFFSRRVFSLEDALDLTQETFLSVYKNKDTFRGEAAPSTWLYSIALNQYRSWLRRREREHAHVEGQSRLEGTSRREPDEDPVSGVPDPGPGPDESAFWSQAVERLERCLTQLTPQGRNCLLLRVRQDLSYREIAQVLRIGEETVRSHLFKARRQLKEELADWIETEGPWWSPYPGQPGPFSRRQN